MVTIGTASEGARDLPTAPELGRRYSIKVRDFVVSLLLFVVAAEVTARMQDWIVRDTPILAVPDWDRDLFVDTPSGRRGRPNGRYLKWSLNEFGFRAGPIAQKPTAGVTRVVVLGSSETFGLYESSDHEFPSLLGQELRREKYEVVNAALTGMTLASTVPYWTQWVNRFEPSIVLIYPSPFFYLNESVRIGPPSAEPRAPAPDVQPVSPASREPETARRLDLSHLRLVQRAVDLLAVPDTIQRWRDHRAIRAAAAGKPAGWLFERPPVDRARQLIADLDALVGEIRRDGARPIVLTHASRFTDPPRPRDLDWLERSRVHTPRATALTVARFETLVNDEIVKWAERERVELIDLHRRIGGRDELFGDLIHFNDAGAAAVADEIAAYLSRSSGDRSSLTPSGGPHDAVQ